MLVDNQSNQIIAPEPVFDNGLSLLCYGMKEDFEKTGHYAATRKPATYQDFIGYVKPLATKRQKDKLRRLLEFNFDKNLRYKLPNYRLHKLEELIRNRAKELLQ